MSILNDCKTLDSTLTLFPMSNDKLFDISASVNGNTQQLWKDNIRKSHGYGKLSKHSFFGAAWQCCCWQSRYELQEKLKKGLGSK